MLRISEIGAILALLGGLALCAPVARAQTGACCLGSGCIQTSAFNCDFVFNGVFLGSGTDCNQGLCGGPGACCLNGTTCVELSGSDCFTSNGVYLGEGTECSPNPCRPPADGACCTFVAAAPPSPAQFNCQLMTAAACAAAGGTYQADGTSCAAAPCRMLACGSNKKGDADGDSLINNFDIDLFVVAILNEGQAYIAQFGDLAYVCRCDVNGDNLVNNFDIDPFAACLIDPARPADQACP